MKKGFTWVPSHKALAESLKEYRHRQSELIDILEKAGVESSTLIDEDETGRIRLEEIDPFTFFCLIHKHGDKRRLEILQEVSRIFDVSVPEDVHGIPTAYALKAMLFPFKSNGRTNEIDLLWEFFEAALSDEITNELFNNVLFIKSVGKSKITEALFNVAPERYLPINAQTNPYLDKKLDIDPSFSSFEEYNEILNRVRAQTSKPFYQISKEAWLWNTGKQHKDEVANELDKTMEQPLNQILFGPPGTGKTYHSVNKALQIVAPEFYEENRRDREKLTEKFRELLITDWAESKKKRIAFTTFHQSYTYEDFVEGIKPDVNNEGELSYKIEDGIFKRICRKAKYYSEGEAEEARERVELSDDEYKKAQFFKVSLGNSNKEEDDEIYQYCIDNDKIAIGYIDHIDLSNKSESEIKKVVNEIPNLSDYSSRAMNYFIHYLKKDHYVLVSKGNTIIRAIGKVKGDYEYSPDAPISYPHFRKVDWLVKDVEIPVEEIYERNLQQQPIYMLKKDWVNREFFRRKVNSLLGKTTKEKFVLIIDEINRGNIAQIFGELITLIEKDKREGGDEEIKAILPYSKMPFSVPSNLYIIGTMNTADRSIEALDTALRRRFTFEEMPPKPSIIEKAGELKEKQSKIQIDGTYFKLSEILKTINQRVEKLIDKDHKIGHSYFMNVKTVNDLQRVFHRNIIPLLEEYFYGDKGKVQLVLGKGFLELFDNSEESDMFALSDYDDSIFEDRKIWKLVNSWRHNEQVFEQALEMLMNQKD